MKIRRANESDVADIARIHVDVWRTTYRGIVPNDYLALLDREKKEQRWRKVLTSDGNDFAFVAETGEKEIVGFASAGENQDSDGSFAGELYTIYLLESFQRRGVGKILMRAIAEKFVERNISSMLLWVLGENRSRAFYESLGGEIVSERKVAIGGAPFMEVAYGWKNLNILVVGQAAKRGENAELL